MPKKKKESVVSRSVFYWHSSQSIKKIETGVPFWFPGCKCAIVYVIIADSKHFSQTAECYMAI